MSKNLYGLLLLAALSSASPLCAQPSLWTAVSQSDVLGSESPDIHAKNAAYFNLGFASLNEQAQAANGSFTIDLPTPDGTAMEFSLAPNTVMQPGLQLKFPQILSFDGTATDGSGAVAKVDISPRGLRATIIRGSQTIFVDPLYRDHTDVYIVYGKSDFQTDKVFSCAFAEPAPAQDGPKSGVSYNSCELRTYRVAVAATGEYTQFQGGTVGDAMAAIVTTINRVNQVYERDFGVTLSLVDNNDEIVYVNASTDPYTNGNTPAMIDQNQSNINSVIGAANYDIGHVFGTNSGGLAGLGVTCNDNSKARGVTGSAAPVGDPFDIDYVAHEMGHQFGATHTFNNSCSGNRTQATAVEPGSGSTIMAYAGICPPNVQNFSDAYFHGTSLTQIGINITNDNCPLVTPISNSAPVLGDVPIELYLPVSTPFALTASATDVDVSDVLTYDWEQMDNEISQQPPVSSAEGGPNFRSFDPSTSPTRYFPRLSSFAFFGDPQWEVLPSVSRDMNFRVTVRDNALGAGCTQYDNTVVHFLPQAGPFKVTDPSLPGIVWDAFAFEDVTWDIAGTDQEPVDCQFVDIFLSLDGGLSYPVQLAEEVPNTGEATVEVPNVITEQARVMVISNAGTFFDVSNNDFEINGIENGFVVLSEHPDSSVCIGQDLVFDISVEAIGEFDQPVNLSLMDPPAEPNIVLGDTELMPGESTTLTLSNTSVMSPGELSLSVLGMSGELQNTRYLTAGFNETDPSAPEGLLPVDGEENLPTDVTINWSPSESPDAVYNIQLATDVDFSEMVVDSSGFSSNTFFASALMSETTYFWRVVQANPCGASDFSPTYSFSTHACYSFFPEDLPLPISPTISAVLSTIEVPFEGTVSDVNILGIVGTHARVSDLTFYLLSPAGTQVELLSEVCGSDEDFDVGFDDSATEDSPNCPPTSGQILQPLGQLANFIGEDTQGDWTLKIADNVSGGGGSFEGWTLQICTSDGGSFQFTPQDDELALCQGATLHVAVDVDEVFDFDQSIDLSVSGLPTGVTSTLTPTTVLPGESFDLALEADAGALPGSYDFALQGTSGETVVERTMTLLLNELSPSPSLLLTPANNDAEVPALQTFTWETSDSPTAYYELDIAYDADFENILAVMPNIDTTAYTYEGLPPVETLYWRVKTTNTCDEVFSDPFAFTTRPCVLQAPQDLPIAISSAPQTYTSTVDVGLSGQLATVRVSGLRGTHFRVSDLSVRLISPEGTEVLLFDSICPGDQDFFMNFEDGGSEVIDCPPTVAGTYAPAEPFSLFADEDPFGIWTLEVQDFQAGGGGELLEWNLEICYTENVFATDNTTPLELRIYPNPTGDRFWLEQAGGSVVDHIDIYDVSGRLLLTQGMKGMNRVEISLADYAPGVYLVRAFAAPGSVAQNPASYKMIKK